MKTSIAIVLMLMTGFVQLGMTQSYLVGKEGPMTSKEFAARAELDRQKAAALKKECEAAQATAATNQKLAAGIRVTNTATQQQQCHYNQLATHYQQQAKDIQQIAKDKQQIEKEKQLIDWEKQLAAEDAARCAAPEVNPWKSDGKGGWFKVQCGEKWTSDAKGVCIDGVPLEICLKIKGECAYVAENDYVLGKQEYKEKKKHTNRSGGGDGTNPGAGGNLNGFLNPGHANHVEKGQTDKATGVPVSK